MTPPAEALRARFDALSPEQQARAVQLMERGRPAIERLGGTPLVLRHAWEACLEYVEEREGDLS